MIIQEELREKLEKKEKNRKGEKVSNKCSDRTFERITLFINP